MKMTCRFAWVAGVVAVAVPMVAQQGGKTYSAHDYAQAERWMSYNVQPLVQHGLAGISYLPDGRVFYRDPGPGGSLYFIADPAKGTKELAFDNAKVVAAVTAGTKAKIDPAHPGFTEYKPEAGGFAITSRGQVFHCDATGTVCKLEAAPPEAKASVQKPAGQAAAMPRIGRRGKGPVNVSPDKKLAVFIRENNLWVRTVATGEEKQLTTDGADGFGYATDNAGWQHSDAAVMTWSADSRKIATFQMDERKTGMMYMVPVTNRHPELEAWHYPLVGDKDVTTIQPVVIDVTTGAMVRLKTPALEHRSMECDDVSCDGDGKWSDVEFSPDATKLAFVATSRDHKDEDVKVADVATGEVRQVHHEHVDTYYGWQSRADWKYLPGSNELLWVSESSNFAQIYLYDLTTGKLKNQVTHGDGPVQDIAYVDEKARVIYFKAAGKEKGFDPYFELLYRVDFDGSHQTLLTPEAATHGITMAKDGSTFVDTYSSVDVPNIYVVRDNVGKVLMTLGKQDIAPLLASGWKPAMPVTLKARDGKTELDGIVWRPTSFDATKKYPVVVYVYPGPQDGSCNGSRAFRAGSENQSLAELGFVVMCVDGQGNPHRSKAFHDAHASKPEEMGDDTIPDQIAAVKDLAAKYPWVDATRVGIWGHSGGGNATVSAMFHFGDFFSVGWAESGNHDNRDYEDDWDERWAGLEVIAKDGKSNYDAHANQNYAKNLTGKLMLVHGTMDDNVPSSNTLLVADALIKANKNFDLLMIPNAHHGYAEATQYVTRRRWDYFVKNLAGGVPPAEYQMKPYEDLVKAFYANQ